MGGLWGSSTLHSLHGLFWQNMWPLSFISYVTGIPGGCLRGQKDDGSRNTKPYKDKGWSDGQVQTLLYQNPPESVILQGTCSWLFMSVQGLTRQLSGVGELLCLCLEESDTFKSCVTVREQDVWGEGACVCVQVCMCVLCVCTCCLSRHVFMNSSYRIALIENRSPKLIITEINF